MPNLTKIDDKHELNSPLVEIQSARIGLDVIKIDIRANSNSAQLPLCTM